MFIINSITNFLSVAPDSFAPLKHMSAINLMFWLALLLFFLEQSVILLLQGGVGGISNIINFDLTKGLTGMINNTFITSGFPLKMAHLIKPFSPFIYAIVYIIILIFGLFTFLINIILSFYTKKQIQF